jgi:hypothetical protein
MKLIPLVATKESIDIKKGGIVYYDTDITTEQEGILLMANENGDYAMTIVDQVHKGGPVRVSMRPILQPAKKYAVGDVIGYIAVF